MLKKIIYIRDDDVFKLDEQFLTFFTFCREKNIPIVYGVIPKLANKALVDFLNREKSRKPHLLDIVQHGLNHTNYSHSSLDKYEFGHSRTYYQQKKDITKGYQIMKRLFKTNFTKAFIPPYHGYDQNTLKVINNSSFSIFSAGKNVIIKNKYFKDYPAEFSLNIYEGKTGKPMIPKASIIIKNFLFHLQKRQKKLGIVFHHSSISDSNSFKEVKLFLIYLKKILLKNQIRVVLFSQLNKKN